MSLNNKKFLWILPAVLTLSIVGIYLFANDRDVTKPVDNKLIESSLLLGDSQKIQIFHKSKPEKGLVIYIVDNKDANKIAYINRFANLSYYVAVIDTDFLTKNVLENSLSENTSCINPSKNLLKIAETAKKQYGINEEQRPILVGSNETSNLVYTALAQSEKGAFHAGISIQFSPVLSTPIPFCEVSNGSLVARENPTLILPIGHLPASWYVFEDFAKVENAENKIFYSEVKNAKVTIAEPPSESAIDEAVQILQWLDPRLPDQISSDISDSDLPLIEVPATAPQTQKMALLLTGDGGWAAIDKNIARILAEKGIPTLGFDALSYFWRARTPDETARDLENAIIQYQQKWQAQDIILIGYSFGADVLPFVTNKLSPAIQKDISLVALLGMGKSASFKFRLSSWLNADKDPGRIPTLPEVANMAWANTLCVYGTEDKESACKDAESLGVKVISMSGDHHFDENYDALVQHILDNVKDRKAQ